MPSNQNERLENRVLLASVPALANYYPLVPNAVWSYDVARRGSTAGESLTVLVTQATRKISGETARRVNYEYDDDVVSTLQNFTKKGQLHIHRAEFDDVSLTLQPPATLPARLRPGNTLRTSGDVDVDFDDFDGDGSYSSTVTVGQRKSVTVPAGTFSAIKVRMVVDFSAEDDIAFGEGPEVDGRLTQTIWLAKGVGVVKATQKYDLDADFIVDNEERSGRLTESLTSFSIPSTQRRTSPFLIASNKPSSSHDFDSLDDVLT